MKYVNIIIYLFIQAISMVHHGGPLNMPNASNTHADSKSTFLREMTLQMLYKEIHFNYHLIFRMI